MEFLNLSTREKFLERSIFCDPRLSLSVDKRPQHMEAAVRWKVPRTCRLGLILSTMWSDTSESRRPDQPLVADVSAKVNEKPQTPLPPHSGLHKFTKPLRLNSLWHTTLNQGKQDNYLSSAAPPMPSFSPMPGLSEKTDSLREKANAWAVLHSTIKAGTWRLQRIHHKSNLKSPN